MRTKTEIQADITQTEREAWAADIATLAELEEIESRLVALRKELEEADTEESRRCADGGPGTVADVCIHAILEAAGYPGEEIEK